MKTAGDIIEEFNNKHKIEDILEEHGFRRKGKMYSCKFHGEDKHPSASVHPTDNYFKCFTCGEVLTPWNFLKKYYNLNSFIEVARKANSKYGANIVIWEERVAPAKKKTVRNILKQRAIDNKIEGITYTVKDYLSEANNNIKSDLEKYRHLLIGANTGIGKTFGTSLIAKELPVDYVIFFVPNRSIAEQIASEGQFKLFYGDDTDLPKSKYIVATYQKVHAIERAFKKENNYRAIQYQDKAYSFNDLISYAVIVDETHELMDKRNMYLKFIRDLEDFIIFAEYSIMMSANITDIYRAYKDKEVFKHTIQIEQEAKHYNADDLYIYRLDNRTKKRLYSTVNIIEEKLKTHRNVLFYKDNIKYMDQLQEQLKAKNINVIFINSRNKEEEAVEAEYKSIIENSNLNKTVVLVTSVINAGVNIKSPNVCAICDMPRISMNSNKMLQFFGRLRGDNKNSLVLLLGTAETPEKKFFRSRDYYVEALREQVKRQRNALDMDLFNRYGLEVNDEEALADWGVFKTGKEYEYTKNCLYYKDGLYRIDEISIIEQARLKEERENYWDNEYIECLTDTVKVRKVHKVEIIEMYEEVQEIEVVEQIIEKSFEEQLKIILEDKEATAQLYDYVTGLINNKKLTGENKVFYDYFKEDRKFKEYKTVCKEMLSKALEGSTKGIKPATEIFKDINKEFSQDNKPKKRQENIKNYRRVEILNKVFPVNTNRDLEITGDTMYIVVRRACDGYVKGKNTITNTAYWQMEEEYLKRTNSKYNEDTGNWEDFKGKKINLEKIKASFNDCILAIYNVSESFKFSTLK